MRLIDLTIRMFTEPKLDINKGLLLRHLHNVKDKKEKLLASAAVAKEDLMSNPKFAELLIQMGVTPPMKISATTGKETYAFAKTDEGFKALLEHEDSQVQVLAAARVGNKSTIEETEGIINKFPGLLYYSMSSVQAVHDCISFFPNIFKASKHILLSFHDCMKSYKYGEQNSARNLIDHHTRILV